MNDEQLLEIRRYLASLKTDQTINVKSYATAIQHSVGGSTKELQDIIRRKALRLGVNCS